MGKLKQSTTSPEAAMNWIVQIGKDLMQALTDPYRPELHYMRGPGPKWRARNSAQRPAG
jgi:hypothetical protein